MELLLLFVSCVCISISFLAIVVNKKYCNEDCKSYLIITISSETENIELIIRDIVFRAADIYGNLNIVFLDCGAKDDTISVINKMLREYCCYEIIPFMYENTFNQY